MKKKTQYILLKVRSMGKIKDFERDGQFHLTTFCVTLKDFHTA